MVYNLSNVTHNASGVLDIVKGVNVNLMGGWLGVLWYIGIMVVIFSSIIYVTNDIKKASLAGGFIGVIISVIMVVLGLLPNLAMLVSILLCVGMMGFGFMKE